MNRIGVVAACTVLTLGPALTWADGLSAPSGEALWPTWQARRLVVANSASSSMPWWTVSATAPRRDSRATTLLLGDRYFSVPGWALGRGSLRASAGLVFPGNGLRVREANQDPTAGLPYLGLGYSGLSVKGGWSLSADIGMVAENAAGATHFGRALLGTQSFDSALREMRLTPLLQLGVSYSF